MLEHVKAHFDCDAMIGAAMEDGGSSGTAGSHWEETLFNEENMTGFAQPGQDHLSTLTLKYFEDTGYYLPNYDLVSDLSFGKGQTCAFLEDGACSSGDFFGFYCNNSDRCDNNYSGFGYSYEFQGCCYV